MKSLRKPSKAELHNLLTRGVEEIINREHLVKLLNSGKVLRIKLGIDPTSPDLHLGHSVVLRKLRQFQDLGHKVVLIIGDFTATIGDPSGRSETRKPLTEPQVKANAREYIEQAGKILDKKDLEVRYNSEWHKREGLESMIILASSASVQQTLRRADFKQRLKSKNDITLLELLYPIFQGYDSVKVAADVELGGTDQKFNLLMGRRVQRFYKMEEQDVMTVPLLEGTDGVKKMSKSLGNYVGFTEGSNEMFRKIMGVDDRLVTKYFLLCTDVSEKEIKKIESDMKSGKLNPRDAKLRLAREIVNIYHGARLAEKAEGEFTKVFSKKELPSKIPQFEMKQPRDIVYVLVKSGTSHSKSDAWRLIKQGAVTIGNKVVTDPKHQIHKDCVLQVGKKRFFKISFKK